MLFISNFRTLQKNKASTAKKKYLHGCEEARGRKRRRPAQRTKEPIATVRGRGPGIPRVTLRLVPRRELLWVFRSQSSEQIAHTDSPTQNELAPYLVPVCPAATPSPPKAQGPEIHRRQGSSPAPNRFVMHQCRQDNRVVGMIRYDSVPSPRPTQTFGEQVDHGPRWPQKKATQGGGFIGLGDQ